MVSDYCFRDGFVLKGTVTLSGSFSNSQELSRVEVKVGHDKNLGSGCALPPKQAKQQVSDDLNALLPTGDKKTDERITKAIEHINKSLNEELWADDSHLSMKGKKVFDEEKKAVKELEKIDAPDVSASTDRLVAIDAELAQTAYDEAQEAAEAAGCYDEENEDPDCDKVLKELAKAANELAKAAEELAKGKPDKAIDHYKKAWEHAQKAMNKLPEEEEAA